jgi:hypothetical protein
MQILRDLRWARGQCMRRLLERQPPYYYTELRKLPIRSGLGAHLGVFASWTNVFTVSWLADQAWEERLVRNYRTDSRYGVLCCKRRWLKSYNVIWARQEVISTLKRPQAQRRVWELKNCVKWRLCIPNLKYSACACQLNAIASNSSGTSQSVAWKTFSIKNFRRHRGKTAKVWRKRGSYNCATRNLTVYCATWFSWFCYPRLWRSVRSTH